MMVSCVHDPKDIAWGSTETDDQGLVTMQFGRCRRCDEPVQQALQPRGISALGEPVEAPAVVETPLDVAVRNIRAMFLLEEDASVEEAIRTEIRGVVAELEASGAESTAMYRRARDRADVLATFGGLSEAEVHACADRSAQLSSAPPGSQFTHHMIGRGVAAAVVARMREALQGGVAEARRLIAALYAEHCECRGIDGVDVSRTSHSYDCDTGITDRLREIDTALRVQLNAVDQQHVQTPERCSRCGAGLPPGGPASTRAWCSDACADADLAHEEGWVRVADMTPEQRAQLDAIIATRKASDE